MKVRMARETEQMRFSEKVYRTQQEKEQQQRQFAIHDGIDERGIKFDAQCLQDWLKRLEISYLCLVRILVLKLLEVCLPELVQDLSKEVARGEVLLKV
mmetsp:Transcript_6961/g.7833  ORF Transcript_6961/g.7833 Transcript_6961/m.7833 type:complete len:98 (-) Transcript_6961:32-325(-)